MATNSDDEFLLEAARQNFTIFKLLVVEDYEQASHLELIDKELEQCFEYLNSNGLYGNNRLSISLPPRSGKTYTATVLYSAYVLGRLPNTRILLASYSKDLSIENSQAVKDIIESEIYQQIFPHVKLSPHTKSKEKWRLALPYNGGVNAISTQGSTTGKGSHLFICDDLFRGMEDSSSPAMRDKIWNWFAGEAMSRLDPKKGVLVMIGTRWNSDDVQGRLNAQEYDSYRWIRIPAFAEDNDPLGRQPNEILWPTRFSEKFLREQERVNGPYQFSAIYQQNPIAREGNWFKKDWFQEIASHEIPLDAFRIRAWDKAVSLERGACWTVGLLLCCTKDGRWIIEDVKRDRLGSYEREKLILETAQEDFLKYGNNVHIWIEKEAGSSGEDSARYTISNLAGYMVFAEKPTMSKDARLEPVAAQAQGKMFYMKTAEWNQLFLDEALAVPVGKYRDQMDALALAFSKLLLMTLHTNSVMRIGVEGLYGSQNRRKY